MKEKNNNIESVASWISYHNVNNNKDLELFKRLFYNMDKEMKKLHMNNYYIKDFNINNILVSGDYIKYTAISLLDSDKSYFINRNIYYLACFELAIYSECLNYINPDNKEYLKENFNDFAVFIPNDFLAYYKGIFVNGSSVYLSDYMNIKSKREMKDSTSFGNNSNISTNGKNMSYNKSTLAGRLLTDDNKAAFIQVFLFPVIIILLAILIPLMIILSR